MTLSPIKRGRPNQGLEVPITIWVQPAWHLALEELTQTTGKSRSEIVRDQLAALVRPKAPLQASPLPAPKSKPLPILTPANKDADEAYWAEKRAKHCPPELAAQLEQKAQLEAQQRKEAEARETAYWSEYHALVARIIAAESTPPEHNPKADRVAQLERLQLFANRAERDLAHDIEEISRLKEELSQLGQPLPVYPGDGFKHQERELLAYHLLVLREVIEQREKLLQLGEALPSANNFDSPQQEVKELKARVVEALKDRHQKRQTTTNNATTKPALPPTPSAPRLQSARPNQGGISRPGGSKPRGRDPD